MRALLSVLLVLLTALAAPHVAHAQDPALGALLQERGQLARDGFKLANGRLAAGVGSVDEVYHWSLRWLEADTAIGSDTHALAAHLARMVELDETTTQRFKTGLAGADQSTAARFFVVEAKLWVKLGARR